MASRATAKGLSVAMVVRRQYVQAMRKRYRAARGRMAKSALLDELVDVAESSDRSNCASLCSGVCAIRLLRP